jgi:4-coumarate--CoA ligase
MQRFDLEQFCRIIQEHKITLAYVVPPVVLLLAKHPIVDKYNLSSLRMMHSSAASLTEDLVKMNHKRLGVPIKQGYGLTECSPGVATQAWESWNKPIGSAGNLLPSLTIKIMDPTGTTEVPTGTEGEIWLSGPNVFKGYWRNPAATAQSITPDRYYRTGDIGYIDSSKNIYITDRVKELIKYNGFQVAPAQLEGLLLGHPAVNDVAVIGVYSEQRATELPRAYIVPAQGVKTGKKLEGEVSEWLNGRVAPYKRLRGGIVWVDEIPKSAAGKVLRRVLSERAKREEGEKPITARL